jgi:hypothetical protein
MKFSVSEMRFSVSFPMPSSYILEFYEGREITKDDMDEAKALVVKYLRMGETARVDFDTAFPGTATVRESTERE